MINPDCLDPREVLAHLNAMGYYDITAQQLKDFIHDLTKLIKYEQKLATRAASQYFYVKPTESPEPDFTECICHPNEPCENLPLQNSSGENSPEESPQFPEDSSEFPEESPQFPEESPQFPEESPQFPEDSPQFPEHSSQFPEDSPQSPQESPQSLQESPQSTQESPQSPEECRQSPEESYYESSTEVSSTSTSATYTASNIKQSSRNQVESEYTPRYHTSFIRAWNLQGCKDLSSRGKKNLDPVRLYHQYKEYWKKQSIPGEDRHLDLRWDIRNIMVGQEPSPRVCI